MADVHLTRGLKLGAVKKEILAALTGFGIEKGEARVETEMIVERATAMRPDKQLVCLDVPVTDIQMDSIEALVKARSKRKPIQYVVGAAHFMGLELKVEEGVFIPRTDTETLVSIVIEELRIRHGHAPRSEKAPAISVLEIGVGSGAISISILKRVAATQVTGTDVSSKAIEITKANAKTHGVAQRLMLIESGKYWEISRKFDVIISNPPYIPSSQASTLQPEVGLFEPAEALFGSDEDGMGFYRNFSIEAVRLLDPTRGFIAVEVGDGQAQPVSKIFEQAGWVDVEIYDDLNKLPRVVTASRAHAGS
jgi:protein-(glutamine-N5) methyltransferase, release factor-specific